MTRPIHRSETNARKDVLGASIAEAIDDVLGSGEQFPSAIRCQSHDVPQDDSNRGASAGSGELL